MFVFQIEPMIYQIDKSAPNSSFPHILKTQPYLTSLKAELKAVLGAMQVTCNEGNCPAHTSSLSVFS